MTGQPGITAAAYMDEAMKAIALAKQALLGGAGGALFVSSGPDLAAAQASPGNPYGSTKHGEFTAGSAAEVEPRRFTCSRCPWHSQPGEYPPHGDCPDCNSAVVLCRCEGMGGTPYCITCNDDVKPERESGQLVHANDGWAEHPVMLAWRTTASPFAADLCPAQWGEPPETMLCSLPSGHDGNHATAEGIEWGGRWETAEPHGGAR